MEERDQLCYAKIEYEHSWVVSEKLLVDLSIDKALILKHRAEQGCFCNKKQES